MGTFAWAALALALVLVGLSVVLYAKLSAGYPRKTRLVQVDLERGGGKELFVMVHGGGCGSRIFDDARKVIRATRADADLMLVDYPPPTSSNADPFEIAVELSDAINTQVVGSHYASVTLVCHCMGALLRARRSSTDATRPTTTRSGTLKRRKRTGSSGSTDSSSWPGRIVASTRRRRKWAESSSSTSSSERSSIG